jgi:hypothetical protein
MVRFWTSCVSAGDGFEISQNKFLENFIFIKQRTKLMNEARIRENKKALIEYDQDTEKALPKKLTLALPTSYQDLLVRMALLNGITKTDIVKQALDQLSIGFGDQLYPKPA